MVFSTIIFLCAFLPITIIGYYFVPTKLKNIFLLLMSLFFYAWGEPKYLPVMLGSILVNYCLGMWISHCGDNKSRMRMKKAAVVIAVVLNIGILFVFKYMTYTMQTIQRFLPEFPVVAIALPIGISFYTFQGLSYVIDVYRGEEAQRNPLRLALYISMFPQLIAGPIVRYKDVSSALVHRTHSAERFAAGVQRFTIGLSKKAVLANMTGELANSVIAGDFSVMSAGVAWLGALAYTMQIYFDFSGYSDMAIGLGQIFGFDFPENFNYPYISRSVREFWRRWHMSLSGWFRDYLYIPLGGNRRGNVYLNLAIVFLATGIWHGAAWGFLLWGIWHGMFILLERFLAEKGVIGKRTTWFGSVLGWVYTMLVVMIGWVLFGVVDVTNFVKYVTVMFGANAGGYTAYGLRYYLGNGMIFYLVLAIIACLPWKPVLNAVVLKAESRIKKIPDGVMFAAAILKRAMILLLLVICYVFIINSSYNPFIYFRF
ncbi:MAG: MBOAT family protein [Lachnospiraceae bacterium]|nr:MBOAT family protein [Lachnospiraceae bacterium]